MRGEARQVAVGRVGRPHGLDGTFTMSDPQHELAKGDKVRVAGTERRVERRAGTPHRRLLRLEGVSDRAAAEALRGETLLVTAELEEGEWLTEDLVGCRVEGLGAVKAVLPGPSCDVLELDDGTLVPLVADAVHRVDTAAGVIEVDAGFLGLEGTP